MLGVVVIAVGPLFSVAISSSATRDALRRHVDAADST